MNLAQARRTSRPDLQLALDLLELDEAVRVAEQAAPHVDVIEAGTLLCLSEGAHAIRRLRAAFPDHPLVADVRIGRVGDRLAKIAFDAGADRVTVLAETPDRVVAGALRAAEAAGGAIGVELGDSWTLEDLRRWADAGVRDVIVHRTYERPFAQDSPFRERLRQVVAAADPTLRVTLAGGVGLEDVRLLDGETFDILVVGSGIAGAPDPGRAAEEYQARMADIWRAGR